MIINKKERKKITQLPSLFFPGFSSSNKLQRYETMCIFYKVIVSLLIGHFVADYQIQLRFRDYA